MKNILIFSPHIDDAFLSLGGTILKWISKGYKVKVYNIFTISDWTSLDSLSGIEYKRDKEIITSLRRKEEQNVGEFVNFDYEFWGFLDFPLRNNFSDDQNQNMVRKISKKITQVCNNNDLLFFPLGLFHTDHTIINTIGNSLIEKEYNVFYYEDMPYYSWPELDYKDLYNKSVITRMPVLEKIDIVKKESILSKYDSQVTNTWLNSIRTYSYNPFDNEYYERYWKAIKPIGT